MVEAFPEVDINTIARSVTRDVFKIGDSAEIEVYDVDSLSSTYIVDRAGNITFPLIGTIQVAGLNTTELQQRLTQRYGQEYLRNPSINVKIESQPLGRVVVDGAVNKPIVFEVSEIISLSEAIAQAEGLDQTSTTGNSVFIVRSINGERKVREVNLKDIRRFGAEDPQIIPNDVIFVQDSAGRVAFREFLRTVPLLNTAVIFASRN
ncbi:polysaccharide biosynthesis/export family protein [Fretibacter rubidus]|uniref:polysaccharide biosynthesis/export family protein n=1 Tax=Fretibacter rubidus TaxID=570162 RepID=UPI00352B21A2